MSSLESSDVAFFSLIMTQRIYSSEKKSAAVRPRKRLGSLTFSLIINRNKVLGNSYSSFWKCKSGRALPLISTSSEYPWFGFSTDFEALKVFVFHSGRLDMHEKHAWSFRLLPAV